jgi:lipoprotein NlpI
MGTLIDHAQRCRGGCAIALAIAFLVVTATISRAIEPLWPDWRMPLIFKMTNELKEADAVVAREPNSVQAYSRRGDLYLFLARFPEAIADFEKMIALDPSEDAPHWRLGIAYYYQGEYAKAARQFEKYDTYDGHKDRENGIWRFLAQVHTDGLEKARAEMLVYTEFDREPFPALYEMFAGRRTPDDLVAEIEQKGFAHHEQVGFFGFFYAGMDEVVLGHRARAMELLKRAVDLMPSFNTVYMWNVARLEWERLMIEQANGR